MRKVGILIFAIAIGLAACGGSSDNSVRTVPANVALPKVAVQNSGTGETVEFSSVQPADKPVLFWFWAPH